jgi:hypothetical protein
VTVSRQTLDRLSGETGFRPDALEKVIRLGELAADIGRQPTRPSSLAGDRTWAVQRLTATASP